MVMTLHTNAHVRTDRHTVEYRCKECGRYVGEDRGILGCVDGAVLFTRRHCPRCNRWRWFNVATGEMVERPMLEAS